MIMPRENMCKNGSQLCKLMHIPLKKNKKYRDSYKPGNESLLPGIFKCKMFLRQVAEKNNRGSSDELGEEFFQVPFFHKKPQ